MPKNANNTKPSKASLNDILAQIKKIEEEKHATEEKIKKKEEDIALEKDEIARLKKQIQASTEETKQAEKKYSELETRQKSAVENATKLDQSIKLAKERQINFKAELETKKHATTKTNTASTPSVRILQRSTHQINSKPPIVSSEQTTIISVNADSREIKKQTIEARINVQTDTKQITDLQKSISATEETVKKTNEEYLTLSKEIQKQKKDVEELEKSTLLQEITNDELTKQIEKSTIESSLSKRNAGELDALKKSFTQMNTEYQHKQKVHDLLLAEGRKISLTHKSKQETYDTLQTQIASMQKLIEATKTAYQSVTAKHEDLQKKMQTELLIAVQARQKELEITIRRTEDFIAKDDPILSMQNQKLKEAVGKLQQTVKNLQQDNEKLSSELQELEEELYHHQAEQVRTYTVPSMPQAPIIMTVPVAPANYTHPQFLFFPKQLNEIEKDLSNPNTYNFTGGHQ